ncbi:hypothetical protein ACEPAG_364 [Sanghuangporus baumii]
MSAALGNGSLYLSLFYNPNGYHWGLLAKTSERDTSPSTLFHATNRTGLWVFTVQSKYKFEDSHAVILVLKIGTLSPAMTSQNFVSILSNRHVLVVYSLELQQETLATVPVVNGDPNFTCLTWAKLALHKLHNESIITCYDIDALVNEAVTNAAMYRESVTTGAGTWGYAISALSR